MNEKALRILEYPKIIERLTDCATSPLGRALCQKLTPTSDLSEICRLQMETSDALTRIYAKGSISFSGLYDIGASLLRPTHAKKQTKTERIPSMIYLR